MEHCKCSIIFKFNWIINLYRNYVMILFRIYHRIYYIISLCISCNMQYDITKMYDINDNRIENVTIDKL